DQASLYATSPHYVDTNHYGPLFSLVIAPFALLPDGWGCLLWTICMSGALFIAIYRLQIDWTYRVIIYYILMNEMYTSMISMQINALIAALIIGSLIAIQKGREGWAACFIMLGCFVKLYSIAGLCFFFFSRRKLKLIGYLALWSAVFFVLPMLISSPSFIVQSYADWYHSLVGKNVENIQSIYQDISVMGMIRRISGNREISNLIVMLPAMLIFALQYVKVRMYGSPRYQLAILASTLLFVVLFSSGSESPTYIIALPGVAFWFILQARPRSRWVMPLLVFAVLLTSFSPSDMVPEAARIFVRTYSLKALPCLIVWLVLAWQIITSTHNPYEYERKKGIYRRLLL
ncbi:MAG: DUF2029 domain-containing protein, partial [Tannerella sp.]|nr:DUF2029 domain-containing protein [Tannerella sp.]